MPTAHLNGLDIHYERAGAGERLLFISGSGGDLRVKPNVLDGPLARAFDVLAYDQRGLGQSGKPDRPYAMADYADDAAALMDELGWDDALVVGVSFGGMVAQEFVLRHPARVKRLVLACTSPGGAGGASFPFHEINHLKGEARARHMIPISDTRRDEAWARANPELYAQFLAAGAADPYADEPGHEMGALRQFEARADHDVWDRLPGVTVPVLIAAGKYDGIARPETQLNLAMQIPGSTLRFFEGGHLFMIQDRAAIPAMIQFLNG
ncbi:MAG TPA: alpha/beta hydrolase [Phenylobacterium sp.]|nr:alpha/beta hydrolase [Phenylobacterium sp.]